MRSNADLLAIKAEMTLDPKHLGLTVLVTDDEANADKLSAVSPAIQVKKRSLSVAAIFNAIDPYEHQAMTDQQSRWFDALLSLGQFDPFIDANIITGLNGLFSAGSNSRPAYTALLTEDGNRIDQMYQAGLLEQGGSVTPSDIANARNAS